MENFLIIKYKYDTGVYDQKILKKLVEEKIISKEQFFEITRKVYKQ